MSATVPGAAVRSPAPAPAAGASALLKHLNPEQLAAVTLPPRPALILAGAGSGKTRVLTTRIAWLLTTGQASPGGVMAVTFTNKAAKEMLARLSAMLPIPVRGMWVGTFHGLCNRFLRAHWKLAGLPQGFQILDTQDQLSSVKRVVKAMGLDEERYVPRQVSAFISGSKDGGLRPGDIVPADERTREARADLPGLRGAVPARGHGRLRRADAAHLRADARPRRRCASTTGERFRHILVDEFQDTNRLQYAWLKMFAGPGASVIAVGDDDQSIYAFRGAQVGNMADFEREFGVEQVIKLEQNYRSHSNILDAANGLISRNTRRLGKNLRTDAGAGEPVRVHEATSDLAEAQWLVEEAQQLHREGTPRHEIAFLYRSNAQSRVIESALFNAAVPYRVYGGLRFFERAEIKHALAYLRLVENASDDTSFLRVVNFPTRGIGARTLEQLQDAARASGRSLMQSVGAVPGRGGAGLAAFAALIEGLREATVGTTLRQIIEHTVEASGLTAHYRADREGQDRLENLAELVNAAEAFVTVEGFGRDAVALRAGAAARGLRRRGGRPGIGRDRLAAGGVPVARRAGGGRQPGAGRAGGDAAHDRALGQGARVRLRLHHRAGGRPVPARELGHRDRRAGGRAAADVRRHHAREEAPLPELLAAAHAARADALQRQEPLLRRAARGQPEVDHAEELRLRRAGLAARPAGGVGQGAPRGGEHGAAAGAEGAGPRPAQRPGGVPRQVRRGRDRRPRRQRAPTRGRRSTSAATA